MSVLTKIIPMSTTKNTNLIALERRDLGITVYRNRLTGEYCDRHGNPMSESSFSQLRRSLGLPERSSRGWRSRDL